MAMQTSSEAPEMSAGRIFELLGAATAKGCTSRLGRISIPGRRQIDTPNYTAVASRGAIPHLTPDNVARHTSVAATYMALEDFVEKKDPPIFRTPGDGNLRRLQKFTCLPSDRITVLAARRCQPVATPMGNGAKAVTLFTSTGFSSITVPQYAAAVKSLQPDVAIPLADFLHTSQTPKSKKLIKMVERTEEWVDEFLLQVQGRQGLEELGVSLFAPVLPVELPIQWEYLRHLAEDVHDDLSGLAVYNVNILPELERYKPLCALPRLSMDQASSPHAVLRQISLGIDICSLSFINSVSDSGVALAFEFPPPKVEGPQALGINMWSPEHSASLAPLADGCQCAACAVHHRAYLQHLLNAKEMLGWNLLQIHNHHIMDKFFAGIRSELSKGVTQFEASRKAFSLAYDAEFPEGTGERPRARGYHFKADMGQDKINKPAWAAELNGHTAASENVQ